MQKINKIIIPIVIQISMIVLLGCARSDDGTLRDNNGNILRATSEEIINNQNLLLQDDLVSKLPKTAEGGIVFDGIVTSIEKRNNGLCKVLMDIEIVLFGHFECGKIEVLTPDPSKGGVNFELKERYRVFTVFLNKAYRTWSSTGSVKLLNKKR